MKNKSPKTYVINMFRTFEECPKKYDFIYNKKIRIPQDTQKTMEGNNLHALINYYLKGHDIDSLLRYLTDEEKKLWENFKSLKTGELVESEYVFHLKFFHSFITGRIDAIFKEGENYIIADWKTGSSFNKKKNRFQTSFYLYSLFSILKEKGVVKDYSQLSMTYFLLKENRLEEIKFTKELFENYERDLKEIILQIEHTEEEKDSLKCHNDNSNICSFCSYKSICPSAKKM